MKKKHKNSHISRFSKTAKKSVSGPITTSPPTMEVLSEVSETDLADHKADEAVISKGFLVFMDVGLALKRIRDRKSYRGTHSSFDAYLAERWNYQRSYASRLINGAEIVKELSSFAKVLPANEYQVRPLLTVPHDKLGEVWENVEKEAKEGVVTTKLIKKAAKPYQPKVEKRKPLSKFKKAIIALLDDLCYFIKETETEKGLETVEKVRLAVLGRA